MENIVLIALILIIILLAIVLFRSLKNPKTNNENLHQHEANLQLAQAELEIIKKQLENEKQQTASLRNELETSLRKSTQVETSLQHEQQKVISEQNHQKELQTKLESLQSRFDAQREELLNLQATLKTTDEKLQNQQTEMDRLQKKFQLEFENVANKILDINSAKFTEKNNHDMQKLLSPFQDKLNSFEKKVEETYEKGLKDQTDMRSELKRLQELNHKISEEAHSLTKALQADNKQQGNWGEMILDKVLERSGLREGIEFSKQHSTENDEGKRYQPDVVINLPEDKHIIIDSKVSLIAYTNCVNSTNPNEQEAHKKDHLQSLKNHVKGLSEKHYSNLKGVNSPDFVLMFLPIESSFSMAVEADNDLYNFAWDKKVVIVSPSTLLATLRTVASIWKQENQTKNTLEIAKAGGDLYDKFVGFVEDMEKIGKNLETTRNSYESAFKKLTAGSGNLVTKTEKLRKLGAKASKDLPTSLIDVNHDEN